MAGGAGTVGAENGPPKPPPPPPPPAGTLSPAQPCGDTGEKLGKKAGFMDDGSPG
jgi:hypothetical protein